MRFGGGGGSSAHYLASARDLQDADQRLEAMRRQAQGSRLSWGWWVSAAAWRDVQHDAELIKLYPTGRRSLGPVGAHLVRQRRLPLLAPPSLPPRLAPGELGYPTGRAPDSRLTWVHSVGPPCLAQRSVGQPRLLSSTRTARPARSTQEIGQAVDLEARGGRAKCLQGAAARCLDAGIRPVVLQALHVSLARRRARLPDP